MFVACRGQKTKKKYGFKREDCNKLFYTKPLLKTVNSDKSVGQARGLLYELDFYELD